MTTLSPAAQAVLDAYNSGFDRPVAVHHKPRIAAALRAAADQAVPESCFESDDITSIRQRLLAIAAELESHD